MRLDSQRDRDRAVVAVGGRLTASQAGRLRAALLEAFDGSLQVEVALQDVTEADLSFLQLLCAAQRTAAARAVGFTLSGLEGAEPVRRLIAAAGAKSGIGCPEGCVWSVTGPAAAGDDRREPG